MPERARTGSPGSSRSYARPSHHVAQPYDPALSRGGQAADLYAMAGMDVLEWQRDVLMDWGARAEDGSGYLHRTCGGSIPRQSGKSTDGIAWALYRALAEGARVLWTDHNYSTTCEMLRRFRRILGSRPSDPTAEHPEFNRYVTATSSKTAQEAIFLEGGGSIHFATRTKSAALGYSFDMVVYDEAQELTDEQQQAILPTTSSGRLHDMQSIYLGTPPRPSGAGDIFRMMRDCALSGESEDSCWWEWGVSEVGDVRDESRWLEVNPSLPEVADIGALRVLSRSMSEFAFAQDCLGYWPELAGAQAVIGRDEWMSCATDRPPAGEADAFGVKFSPDGSTVALAVAKLCGASCHVELVDVRSTARGTRWLADAIVAAAGRAPFVLDGRAGASALLERVSPDVPEGSVSVARTADAIAACSSLLDAVREGSLTWFRPEGGEGDDRLSLSATTSTRRRIGSNGGWGFGGDDPTPVEAASLALWLAMRSGGEEGEDMAVYF